MQRESWVPPGADPPIRLRFEHTLFGHWGARSGYPRFVANLSKERFSASLHGAKDSHEECPAWLRPAKPWLVRALKRRRMQWYKLSDLNAEIEALGDCLRGKVDIVHFLDGEHSGQFLPQVLRRTNSRVRTIATFHQPPDLLDEILDPALVRHLDHVVLMSPSQRPYFEGKIADERVSVILHGVDTDFFHAREAERTSGPIRCVTAGHWLRDWHLFREVALRLPEVEFHAVTSRETGADDLPNVRRRQGLSDDELAALYRNSDILFLPLLDSTANNALLEGMASGLPLVATDLIATRVYSGGMGAILTPMGDAQSTIAALRQLVQDAPLRQRLGIQSRERANMLNWAEIAREYERLFTRVYGARRDRRSV